MKQTYMTDKILKKISKYEYVSFDVFDTLIKRNIQRPHDIFRLVEQKYNSENKKNIENYVQYRVKAEKKAKEKFKNGECTFDSIFEELKEIYNQDTIAKLKKLELKLEETYCTQNKMFYPVYKKCVSDRKKIIIITDMYLDKNVIANILSKNGINQYEDIFVSSELKLNKHNGTIYSYVLNKLNINRKQIIHIGDSKRGDYIMARKNGISSILIPKNIKNLEYYNKNQYEKLNENEQLVYRTIETFINNNMPKNYDEYYRLGYEILGILLYGYIRWLIAELKKKDINKIYFLSREGAILKRAFDLMNDTKIESRYLYVSRRSTRVPLLKNINNYEDIFKIVKMRKVTDIKSFFINVGLNVENYIKLLKKYNCKENTNINTIENMQAFFEEIKPDIIQNAQDEEKNLIGYLKQEDFTGRFAIADIGWEGTMQNALCTLSEAYNLNANIVGFYVGQSQQAKKYIDKGIKTEAYLFNYKTDGYNEVRPFLNLFESLFLAQHGTTVRYKYEDNMFKPVLAESEYSEKERKLFKEIQDGAMQFINDYKNNEDKDIALTPKSVSINIKNLGLYPKLKDVNLFCDITYLETIKASFAEPKSLFYYIIHPKEAYIDFCNCSWKIGFLKKLLKIKLNYFKLYKKLVLLSER